MEILQVAEKVGKVSQFVTKNIKVKMITRIIYIGKSLDDDPLTKSADIKKRHWI